MAGNSGFRAKPVYGSVLPIVYAGLVFLCVSLLAACGSPAPEPKAAETETSAVGDPATAKTLVLAFGDSLYAGYQLKPSESFPAKLETALRGDGLDVAIINAGVSGDTSAAGLQRFAYALDNAPRKPDLVIFGLGGNDMLRGISPEQTRSNIKAMLDELRKREIPAFMTGLFAAPNLGPEYMNNFNAIFPELAKEYDAGLYPFMLDGVIGNDALMLADGVHPNAAGVDVIVGKVAPLVAAKIKE